MKVSEILIEAIIKTEKGSIIRAQSSAQIDLNIKKSGYDQLRALIFPNQIWFTDGENMIHSDMAKYLIDNTSISKKDIDASVGVTIEKKRGYLFADGTDFNWHVFNKMKQYSVIKRFKIVVGTSPYADN